MPLSETVPPKLPVPMSVPPVSIVTGPLTMPVPLKVAPVNTWTKPEPVAEPVTFVTRTVLPELVILVPPE